MAFVKIVNAEDGSDARYDVNAATPEERRQLDSEGRPLSNNLPGQWEWTPGLPGARGGNSPGGGGGGGGGGGIPGGAIIAQQLALAKKAYETALARITNKRQTLGRESGFTFDVDTETGVMRSMRVDPKSIYGTFQILNRQQALRDESARSIAIERGLGAGGGLAAQLRSNAKYQAGQEDAQFSSTLIDQLSGLASDQQEAKHAYDSAKYQAELEQLRLQMSQDWGGGGGGGGGSDGGGGDDDGGFIYTPEGNLDHTGTDIRSAQAEHLDLMRRRAMPQRPRPKPVRTNYRPNLPMGIQRR